MSVQPRPWFNKEDLLRIRGRSRHARYFEPNLPYHVISRTPQSFYLLRPDARGHLRSITAAVLARARCNYKAIRLHAAVFMSNHLHLVLSGGKDIPAFMRYVKGEISRRWRPKIGWSAALWEGYKATALLTPEAQLNCLRYVLSHGVKEHLVGKPQNWPGLHCAEALMTGRPVPGKWFNATEYGRAHYRERVKKNSQPVRMADYLEDTELHFDALPALEHLTHAEHRQHIKRMVDEIVAAGHRNRRGRKPLGLKKLFKISRWEQGRFERPPWYEERVRMVVWDNLRAPVVRAYLNRYWKFQQAFRAASRRLLGGQLDVEFPIGAFRPGLQQAPAVQALPALG